MMIHDGAHRGKSTPERICARARTHAGFLSHILSRCHLLIVFEAAVDFGEIEGLSHDALVNVQHVFARGLEMRRSVVRFGNEHFRRGAIVDRNLEGGGG